MNHPTSGDAPQGTDIAWSDAYPDRIEVLVWANYSPGIGEYNATVARFTVDDSRKTLTLDRVSIKRKYSPWDDGLTNPSAYVSDRMKRVVRAFIAKETGSAYWRVAL